MAADSSTNKNSRIEMIRILEELIQKTLQMERRLERILQGESSSATELEEASSD